MADTFDRRLPVQERQGLVGSEEVVTAVEKCYPEGCAREERFQFSRSGPGPLDFDPQSGLRPRAPFQCLAQAPLPFTDAADEVADETANGQKEQKGDQVLASRSRD